MKDTIVETVAADVTCVAGQPDVDCSIRRAVLAGAFAGTFSEVVFETPFRTMVEFVPVRRTCATGTPAADARAERSAAATPPLLAVSAELPMPGMTREMRTAPRELDGCGLASATGTDADTTLKLKPRPSPSESATIKAQQQITRKAARRRRRRLSESSADESTYGGASGVGTRRSMPCITGDE